MPHRDPETGKFVSTADSVEEFDEIEEVHGQALMTIAAANLDGSVGQTFGQEASFESEPLYSLDTEILDRREVAVLIWAEHRLDVYLKSTATADGTVRAAIEVTTSPDLHPSEGVDAPNTVEEQDTGPTIDIDMEIEQDAEHIGRVLNAVGFSPITDGTNGVGGAGTAGFDTWEGAPMASPVFDDRDDILMNGFIETSNVTDNAVGVDLTVRHVYGVLED